MKRAIPITTLFLDIGGVLLTNGWDHHARKRAATNFKLELAEMEDRHHLTLHPDDQRRLVEHQVRAVGVWCYEQY